VHDLQFRSTLQKKGERKLVDAHVGLNLIIVFFDKTGEVAPY
jgi:hypothetical protein